MAHTLGEMEKVLREMQRKGAPPAEIRQISRSYYDLQNRYYAVLDQLEAYEPDRESAARLTEFEQKLSDEGHRLSEKEREKLKREILLSPLHGNSNSRR
jgi:hypothetical protein